MGLQSEVERYKEIILHRDREDLNDFMRVLNVTPDGSIQIPLIDHPEIEYDGSASIAGSGDPRPGEDGRPDVGDIIPKPQDGQGEGEGEGDDAGEGSGNHGMMDLDPEDIEEVLEEQYELEFEPGGEETSTVETEGDFTDETNVGTNALLNFDKLFKGGLKKKLATHYDPEFVQEAFKVDGYDVRDVFYWARENSIPVSRGDVEDLGDELSEEIDVDLEELDEWENIEEMEENVDQEEAIEAVRREGVTQFYRDDERYRAPETIESEEEDSSAVVFNYRDVSGSVDDWDREMISHLFAPMDEYLRAKYDNVRFVYVAHDSQAWEVERDHFYQLKSGGGTKVSSALELIEAMVEGEFNEYLNEEGKKVRGIGRDGQERILTNRHKDVWQDGYGEEWDKYYFGAGDGGNGSGDMDKMTEMIVELPGKKHLHAEIKDGSSEKMYDFRKEVEDYDHVIAPEPIYQKDEIPDVWREVFDGN